MAGLIVGNVFVASLFYFSWSFLFVLGLVFCCCFVRFRFFDTGFLYVAMADLELAL